MMELSIETPDDILDSFRKQKLDTSHLSTCQIIEDTDIIDVSQIFFGDDESWLYDTPKSSQIDLQQWLYCDEPPPEPKIPTKNIDTRTFTRPKKRFTRPSIEKYNEELYGSEMKELTDSGIHLNGNSQDDSPVKPLHFDLEQNASSVYFDNILANAPMMDSFQNMSPPSLVNSMCSSTFANLMESSFIKNDPVLREIRDTDFTGSILQQEAEPMFHSITESYSSLNSDVPENFLKKVSYSELGDMTVMNATFTQEDSGSCNQTVIMDVSCEVDFQDAKPTTIIEDLNVTYPRTKSSETPLNSTFQRRKIDRRSLAQDLNATVTIEPDRIEPVKRLLDRRPSPSLDLNRLSYLVDKNQEQMNATFTNESPKRNSFGSTDSGENLDYMSLSSSSSKSSTRRQSTDAINTIVEKQERTAFMRRSHQISSTPKPRTKTLTLFPNHEISPIRDRNSDPELSSDEQQQTVMLQNAIRKQKSVGHINQIRMPVAKTNFSSLESKGGMRGSQPNLKINESRIQRGSNLNSMGHTLKGSYTSLKPTNTNLPVAPPPLDTTVTLPKNPAVAQVPPLLREAPSKGQDAQFVKPQPPRSGLPRPVTGIPRPVSRIPGPRTIRPVSKSAGYQGRY